MEHNVTDFVMWLEVSSHKMRAPLHGKMFAKHKTKQNIGLLYRVGEKSRLPWLPWLLSWRDLDPWSTSALALAGSLASLADPAAMMIIVPLELFRRG